MEILTVEQGKGEAGIETGGERTLVQQTPTATAPPPTPPPDDKAGAQPLTETELEARRAQVIASMWGGKKEVAPPAPSTPPPSTPPPAEAVAAPAPAAPATPPPAETPPAATPPTTTEIIQQTAKAVAEAVKGTQGERPAAAPTPEPADLAETLNDDDLKDLAVFQRMESMNPAMKGKADEFKRFAKARYDYEAEWAKKNPGTPFNADDPEHEAFYKTQPDYDEDLFEEARVAIIADQQVEKRLRPEREKAMLDQAKPVIEQNLQKRIHAVLEQAKPEFAALARNGEQIALTQEAIDKMMAADPIAGGVLDNLMRSEVIPILAALEHSMLPGHALQPGHPVTARVDAYLDQFEKKLGSAPANERQREGREFITIAEKTQKQQAIMDGPGNQIAKQKALKKLDVQYWVATIDDVETMLVADVAQRAKAQIELLDGLAQKKYRPAAPNPGAVNGVPPSAPTPPNRAKPPSVSGGSSEAVDTTKTGAAGAKSFGEIAVETHWRK